jgi:hypothetical protein
MALEIRAGIHLLAFPGLGYPVSEAVKDGGITTVHYRLHARHSQGDFICPPRAKAFTANLAAALGLHRAWERAAKVMSSAVPPAA